MIVCECVCVSVYLAEAYFRPVYQVYFTQFQTHSFSLFNACLHLKPRAIPTVNFINIIRTNFSYETLFQQLFSSYMYVKKRHSYEKFVRKMLMKLTTRRRHHKSFIKKVAAFLNAFRGVELATSLSLYLLLLSYCVLLIFTYLRVFSLCLNTCNATTSLKKSHIKTR